MPQTQGEVGPYRILRRLGVGGMAETFEAVRSGANGFEQRICLKCLLPTLGEEVGVVSRLAYEARLAAELRHPNVVSVLEFGSAREAHYLALELVDGLDLRSLLASLPDRRLPPDQVTLVAIDLAEALAYAHDDARHEGKPGIVHRDVSSSNVLVGRAGEVKLTDFGIAKAMRGASATASSEVRGKIPYMAPEQMRGEQLDGRADLFSLGVVLFEALSGVRPYDGSHDVETMTRILAGDRRDLAETASDTPPKLARIVERLLAPRAADRFESADALLDALSILPVDPLARLALADTVEERVGGLGTREHVRRKPTGAHSSADGDALSLALDLTAKVGASVGAARETPAARSPDRRASEKEPPQGRARSERSPSRWRLESIAGSGGSRVLAVGALIAAFAATGSYVGRRMAEAERSSAAGTRALEETERDLPSRDGTLAEESPSPSSTPGLAKGKEGRSAGEASPPPSASGGQEAGGPTAEPSAPAEEGRGGAPEPTATEADAERLDPSSGARAAVASNREEPTSEPASAGPPATASSPGWVRVTVIPWGRVWVDGRPTGRAPRTLRLSPGVHLVQAGQERPTRGRRVRIREGRRARLEFELR